MRISTFFYRIMLRVGKVGVVPQPLYCYRQHPDTAIYTFSRKRADVLDVTDRMLAWVGENYPQLVPAAEDRRMSAHFNILSLLYRNRVRDNELEERCWRVIREQRVKSMLNGKVRFKEPPRRTCRACRRTPVGPSALNDHLELAEFGEDKICDVGDVAEYHHASLPIG